MMRPAMPRTQRTAESPGKGRRALFLAAVVVAALCGALVAIEGRGGRSNRYGRAAPSLPREGREGAATRLQPSALVHDTGMGGSEAGHGHEWALEPVRVRVLAETGEPLQGARVDAYPTEAVVPGAGDRLAGGLCDSEGIAELMLPACGAIAIVACSTGYLPGECTLSLPPGPETEGPVEIKLAPGETATATLSFESGSPAAGVPVLAVGVGYSMAALRREPLMRAYPGSGCASGISNERGEVLLPGVGAEPLLLGLGPGWMFAEVNYTDGYPLHGLQPVLYSGKRGTFVVYRKCRALLRAIDREEGTAVSSCYSAIQFTARGAYLRTPAHDVGSSDLGLSGECFPYDLYRGSGVYAFPVMQAGSDVHIRARVGFFGYEHEDCEMLLLPDGDPVPPAEEIPATRFARTGPPLGSVHVTVPEGVFRTPPAALLCGAKVRATDPKPTVWSYAGADADGSFVLQLPPGDFADLSFGHPLVGLCRSGPFAVAAGRSTNVRVTHEPARLIELCVQVWDEEGRPLPGADITISVASTPRDNDGTGALRNVGGSSNDRTRGDRWPIRTIIQAAEAFDAEMRARDLHLTVFRPGFEVASAVVLVDPNAPPQVVEVRMRRADARGWAR